MKKTLRTILCIIAAFQIVLSGLAFFPDQSCTVTDEWKTVVRENYLAFISEAESNSGMIPMIVSTDQHGAVSSDSEIYRYVNSLVDWEKISAIINLGDVVDFAYDPSELQNYRNATQCLPENKRIEVIGNHDRLFALTGRQIEERYFPNPSAAYSEDGRAFAVEDERFKVRYLAVDTKCFPYYYTNGRLWTEQADFIIRELSKEDESDVILLSHAYLFNDGIIARDGSVFTGSECFIGSENKGAEVKRSFIDMLAARKNRSSGVLTDSEGVAHPYDFSNCKGSFLLTLHGHHHSEGYETRDGITEFLFQSMLYDNKDDSEAPCFYFALIDTKDNTLKVWKNVAGYAPYEVKF